MLQRVQFLARWFQVASLGIQGSRFAVEGDTEVNFTQIELEVPMEPSPQGEQQQEPWILSFGTQN